MDAPSRETASRNEVETNSKLEIRRDIFPWLSVVCVIGGGSWRRQSERQRAEVHASGTGVGAEGVWEDVAESDGGGGVGERWQDHWERLAQEGGGGDRKSGGEGKGR